MKKSTLTDTDTQYNMTINCGNTIYHISSIASETIKEKIVARQKSKKELKCSKTSVADKD